MRHWGILFIIFAILLFTVGELYSSSRVGYDFSDDVVIVVLKPNISRPDHSVDVSFFGSSEIKSAEHISKITSQMALSALKARGSQYRAIYKITLCTHDKSKVWEMIDHLKKIEGVESVEPNYAHPIALESNDPSYSSLWGLHGTHGIQAPEAWNYTTGSHTVRVGVIDTGVASHSDLDDNVTIGWDFFNGEIITTDDINSHGTHVSGTIGAVGNNDEGVVGVNWNVTIVPMQSSYRADNGNDYFTTDTVVYAITWATNLWGTAERISVINYSVSGYGSTTSVRAAVNNFPGLYVWAAGNSQEDVDIYLQDFGSFNLSNILAVGAMTEYGDRSSFSNYSSSNQYVPIFAPGSAIYSTDLYNEYSLKSGTSMAAPHVAGVAALILSYNPSLTAPEVKELITSTATPLTISTPSGTLQRVNRLNVYNAFTGVTLPPPTNLTATLSNNNVMLSWSAPAGTTPLGYNVYRSQSLIPINATPISQTNYIDQTVSSGIIYDFRVCAVYAAGESISTNSVHIKLPSPTDGFITTFEDGSTNGWIVINGTFVNRWIVGTGTAASSIRSIYISNDNSQNVYTTTEKYSIVHFFRDIVYASETGNTLSFDFRGVAEMDFDYLRVYLCEPVYAPVAGSVPSGILLGEYSGYNIWSSQTINLPDLPVNTVKRIIFTWKNDFYEGDQPPAAVDNIVYNNGGSSPLVSLSATSLDFGYVGVNSISPQKTFSISNIGGSNLVVDTITLTGVDADDYHLTLSGLPWTIIPATYRTFTVTLSPSSVGEKIASIILTHDTAGSPINITLSGRGYPPISAFPWYENFSDNALPMGWINDGGWAFSDRQASSIYTNARCITPQLQLPITLQNRAMFFSYRVSNSSNNTAEYQILISTSTSPDVFTVIDSNYLGGSYWLYRSIDLSAYEGQSIQIAIQRTGGSSTLYLDDVWVGEGNTLITSFPFSEDFTPHNDGDDDSIYMPTGWINEYGWLFGTLEHARNESTEGLLITPRILFPNSPATHDVTISFTARSSEYEMSGYNVFVSTTGTSIDDFTLVDSGYLMDGILEELSVNLSLNSEQSIYIAFQRIFGSVYLDDLCVNLSSIFFNPPQTLTATASHQPNGDSQVVLSWQAPQAGSSGTLSGYRVYRDGTLLTLANLPQTPTTYTDTNVIDETTYSYTVRAIYENPTGESPDSNTDTATPQPLSDSDEVSYITQNQLYSNFPNPFNPTTTISFDIANDGNVLIDVYNIKGQKVKTLTNDIYKVGKYYVVWNGDDYTGRKVGSGVYFYKLTVSGYSSIHKMLLMK